MPSRSASEGATPTATRSASEGASPIQARSASEGPGTPNGNGAHGTNGSNGAGGHVVLGARKPAAIAAASARLAPAAEPQAAYAARRDQFASFQADAPPCDRCGALTARAGNCYLCYNCGNSMGCS